MWGVAKAYATRVGAGPFPTELDDDFGERLRKAGGEFGTTTGRARRTGWLDLVALRYAVRINGMTHLAITKLDVLSGLGDLKVCTSYVTGSGAKIDDFPYHQSVVHQLAPRYATLFAAAAFGSLGRTRVSPTTQNRSWSATRANTGCSA